MKFVLAGFFNALYYYLLLHWRDRDSWNYGGVTWKREDFSFYKRVFNFLTFWWETGSYLFVHVLRLESWKGSRWLSILVLIFGCTCVVCCCLLALRDDTPFCKLFYVYLVFARFFTFLLFLFLHLRGRMVSLYLHQHTEKVQQTWTYVICFAKANN